MDSAEKKLWVSVVAQAIKDAHGAFDIDRDFEQQYNKFEKSVLDIKSKEGEKTKNPSLMRLIYPEKGGAYESNCIREARAWFCDSGFNAKNLKEVCGYADVCPQRLSKQMSGIIGKLRTLEQKLLQVYKETNNGTICK